MPPSSTQSSAMDTPATTAASLAVESPSPIDSPSVTMDIVGLRTQIIANWRGAHPGHINPVVVIYRACNNHNLWAGAIMTDSGPRHPWRQEVFHKFPPRESPEAALREMFLVTCSELSWIGDISEFDLVSV